MYVATASPRPKISAFDSSRGGMCPVFPPLDPPLGRTNASNFIVKKSKRYAACACASRGGKKKLAGNMHKGYWEKL